MALIEMNDHLQFEIPMQWLGAFVDALEAATTAAEEAGAEGVELDAVLARLPAQAARAITRRQYQVPRVEELL